MRTILVVSCLAVTAVALAKKPGLRRAVKSGLRLAVAKLLVALEGEPGSAQHRP